MNTYTKPQVLRALVCYHNLDHSRELQGIEGVRTLMKQLGSIQYDPLHVVGRNADLVLAARIPDYRCEMLEELLYGEHFLVDGFDKEMCIYLTEDFEKFAYVRRERLKNARLTLQYRGQMEALEILQEVLDFVEKNGATGTKDISIGEVRESRWGPKKLSSAALEYLCARGDLTVAGKRGTQKQFDLTRRVIPESYFTGSSFSDLPDFLDWYVKRRIAGVGMLWDKKGAAWQGAYIYDNKLRKEALGRLVEKGELISFAVEGLEENFYCGKDFLAAMEQKRERDYARFIAPLDNMIWDRNMTEKLFDFAYSWEVYTPVAKRRYGYYVLPVLYNDRFVARFEAEPVKKCRSFKIKQWWWEPGILPTPEMKEAIEAEMERFAKFLNVDADRDNMKFVR